MSTGITCVVLQGLIAACYLRRMERITRVGLVLALVLVLAKPPSLWKLDYEQPHSHFEQYSDTTSRAGANRMEISGRPRVALDEGEWLPYLQPYIQTRLRTVIVPVMGLVPVGLR